MDILPVCRSLALSLGVFMLCGPVRAAPSILERLAEDVMLVRDDAGNWGGGIMGITHQVRPDYQAKKVLDLRRVPEAFWNATTEARLSVYFCVRDYSWRAKPERNGLDEAFDIVVNGRVRRYANDSGVPVYAEGKAMETFMRWHDFAVPKAELVRGPNELLFRKAPTRGKEPDDYLYLGIDNSVPGGRSWVKFGADGDWRQDKLTIPGGKGEYMVRLYLLRGDRRFQATWVPKPGRFDDPLKIIAYAGSHAGPTRVEWDPLRLDPLGHVAVAVQTEGEAEVAFQWLDAEGEPVGHPAPRRGPRFESELHPPLILRPSGMQLIERGPLPFRPSGVQLSEGAPLSVVTLEASRSYHRLPHRIDMAPPIAEPRGRPAPRRPTCTIEPERIELQNFSLRCELAVGETLRLASLYNELAAAEMAPHAWLSSLFVVEVEGQRYEGSRDFACRRVEPLPGRQGFAATLSCEAVGLEAVLRGWIDSELQMGLTVTNRAEKPVDFKVAFPHLTGLAISEEPAADHYFHPWGGGIIADAPAVIRRGYGDHAAIYQLMDLFSPERGAGLAVWCTDTDGRYKVLALRKHVPEQPEANADKADTPTAEEFKWTNSLPGIPGVGFTYEYLRRTRKPGESFAAKDVALKAHAGDWHAAMKLYADWCHRVWRFRPYPSRLTPVLNMIACGWGQSPLYAGPGQPRLSAECGYRADFSRPRWDCIELMSWWEWADLGPWRTPWDQLKQRLGEAKYQRYRPYYVRDPVTGKTMYPINRGDYDGYNARWGGLPALRRAIQAYQEAGQLVTLYTDPILADDNTRLGQQHGKQWGIVQPDGSYRTAYESWNMCHDVAEYRQYVADTMRRVMKDTGADGIRLDEYGHKGAACFSKLHQHTFAEPGCTEWQRAIAETTKLVRQAMDEAKPGSVLTTEHPGYDYLLPFIEGCITYDLTVQATPLRPLEVNLQRFYFPECKAFELDHRGADRQHRKRFWNAVGSFGSVYPVSYYTILKENADAFDSRDCTALVPTEARRVYANRFRAEGKTLLTLYNATGHTFAGPALQLDLARDQHVFDLLRSQQADVRLEGAKALVTLYLPRGDVACLAVLPRCLRVRGIGDHLEVTLEQPKRGWELRACNRDGQALATAVVVGRVTRLSLADLPDPALAVCVKLLDEGRLLDIAAATR